MRYEALALAILPLLTAPGFGQTLTKTTLPDGRIVEAETVAGLDGTTLRHGSYKVFAPDGDDWLVDGEYVDGVREGKWAYRYHSGEKLASGKYQGGARAGRWKFYWQSGDLSSEGVFKDDAPAGKWLFYELGGDKKKGTPVTIARVAGVSALDQCSYSGLLGNGEPIGWWRIVRNDGSTLFEGAFSDRGRLRSALYRHAGDVADPVFFAEVRDALHPDDYAFQSVDEYGATSIVGEFPELEVEPGLASGLAFVRADPALSDVEQVALQPLKPKTTINVYPPGVKVRDLRFQDSAALWAEVAAALKTACAVDWNDYKGQTSAVNLFQDVIEPGLGYPDLGIDFSSKTPAAEKSHLALLRIHSLLSMYRNNEDFWSIDAQLATTAPPEKQELPRNGRIDPTLWLSGADLDVLAAERGDAEKAQTSAAKRAPRAVRSAIQKGLGWLVAEQREDGSWPAATAYDSEDITAISLESRGHDVGVTALAVLALLRDPMTRWREDRMNAIRKGCAFILSSRVRSRGYFATVVEYASPEGDDKRSISRHWIYGQAACLQALAEVTRLISTSRIEVGIRDAAAALMQAKNPFGAWRYASPPNGDNDISVTFWVMRALLSAENAGVPMADGVAKVVMQFVAELTDGETGRTGYTERGSRSSRVVEWNGNDHSANLGETLTAEAISLRHWLGHGSDPVSALAAELLLQRLPEWDSEGSTVDYGYWLAGTEALRQVGGKPWKVWSGHTRTVLTKSQVTSGEGAGSWPAIGVWCPIGGRNYATATAILALQQLQ